MKTSSNEGTGRGRNGDRLQFRSPIDAAGFTQASNLVLLDPALSDGAKVTYFVLRMHAWQDLSCYPGQDKLAAERKLTPRSVRAHLAELGERGLITTEQRGLRQTNIYWIEDLCAVYGAAAADRKNSSGPDRKFFSGPIRTLSEEDAVIFEKDSGTLNVKGELDLMKATLEPIQRVVALTGDTHSVRRFEQLWEVAVQAGWGSAWDEALRSLRKRMANDALPSLEKPGAYFCAALCEILRKRGVAVPVGTAQEREDVRAQIAASLTGEDGGRTTRGTA